MSCLRRSKKAGGGPAVRAGRSSWKTAIFSSAVATRERVVATWGAVAGNWRTPDAVGSTLSTKRRVNPAGFKEFLVQLRDA
jgi:hypothetical protein